MGIADVVKAGQHHIVIDVVRTKEREMYVAMAADNSLSIQHKNTNTEQTKTQIQICFSLTALCYNTMKTVNPKTIKGRQ